MYSRGVELALSRRGSGDVTVALADERRCCVVARVLAGSDFIGTAVVTTCDGRCYGVAYIITGAGCSHGQIVASDGHCNDFRYVRDLWPALVLEGDAVRRFESPNGPVVL